MKIVLIGLPGSPYHVIWTETSRTATASWSKASENNIYCKNFKLNYLKKLIFTTTATQSPKNEQGNYNIKKRLNF